MLECQTTLLASDSIDHIVKKNWSFFSFMNLCPKLDLNLYVKVQLAYINYAIRLKSKDLKEDLKTLKI